MFIIVASLYCTATTNLTPYANDTAIKMWKIRNRKGKKSCRITKTTNYVDTDIKTILSITLNKCAYLITH